MYMNKILVLDFGSRFTKDIDDILLKKMEDVWVNTKIDEDIENYVGIEQVLYYYFSVIKNNERFFSSSRLLHRSTAW